MVNEHRLARVDYIPGVGYYVCRDDLAPEMEPVIRALEDGPGSDGELAYGEIRGLNVAAPSAADVKRAQREAPRYRPRPEPKT